MHRIRKPAETTKWRTCSGRSSASSAARFFYIHALGIFINNQMLTLPLVLNITSIRHCTINAEETLCNTTPSYVVSNTHSIVLQGRFFLWHWIAASTCIHIGQDRSHLETSSSLPTSLGWGCFRTPASQTECSNGSHGWEEPKDFTKTIKSYIHIYGQPTSSVGLPFLHM